jgi:hypothetical protein
MRLFKVDNDIHVRSGIPVQVFSYKICLSKFHGEFKPVHVYAETVQVFYDYLIKLFPIDDIELGNGFNSFEAVQFFAKLLQGAIC